MHKLSLAESFSDEKWESEVGNQMSDVSRLPLAAAGLRRVRGAAEVIGDSPRRIRAACSRIGDL